MKKYLDIHETRKDIDEKILKIYKYGSIVYGCNTINSDVDYIVVVDSQDDLYYSVQTESADYTVYSEPLFIKRIKEHHISVMECIFQSEDDPYVKYFELNLEALRREISSVSSNSFVKCKKKLRDGEDYIGKKSMFHSLRILVYGIQIAKFGKIYDYGQANFMLSEIMKMEDWDEIKNTCQPIFNSLKTRFKLLAPLESDTE